MPKCSTGCGRIYLVLPRWSPAACPAELWWDPGKLIEEYQRNLRFYGVDNMSTTGGVLSSAHTTQDIEESTAAFAQTVESLLAQG